MVLLLKKFTEKMLLNLQSGYAFGALATPNDDYGLGSIMILNITNPASPSFVSQLSVNRNAIGLDVFGNYAYLAAGNLEIVDITNPAAPFIAGSFIGNGYASDVSVHGNYAYLTQVQGDFYVVNISNPSNPFLLSGMYFSSRNYHNFYENGYVAVSDLDKGIYLVDVANPTYPFLCDTAGLSGFTCDVFMSGDYVYVADGYGGLKIFTYSSVDTFPPVIFNTTVLHNTSSLGPFLVSTKVIDHSGVDSALLFYKRSEDPGFTALSMGTVSESDYLDSIPMVNQSPDTVMYYIQAWDSAFFSLDPTQGPDSAYCFLVDTSFVGPVIESTTVWHDIHYSGPFPVFTKVYDSSGIASVFLCFKRLGIDPDIVQIAMTTQGDSWFNGIIPDIYGYGNTTIFYYIIAENLSGVLSFDPVGAPGVKFEFQAYGGLNVDENSINDFDVFNVSSFRSNIIAVSLNLPVNCEVSLKIFDVSGRLLDEPMSGVYRTGLYNVEYNPPHNGVYIVTCTAGGKSYTKKVTVME